MGTQDFNVERTRAGLQFMIPGTEKPIARQRIRYPADGAQLVIPGAEQISGRTLINRMIQKPLRPRVGQRGLSGTSLFGASHAK